jgi:hypothetical protein
MMIWSGYNYPYSEMKSVVTKEEIGNNKSKKLITKFARLEVSASRSLVNCLLVTA